MMTDEEWEYCILYLSGLEWKEKFKGKEGWECILSVSYLGNQSSNFTLARNVLPDEHGRWYAQLWSQNPWEQTIGLLGTAGWELVSIQHGNNMGLVRGSAVASFKRPKKSGRQVDEPKIVLSPEPVRVY